MFGTKYTRQQYRDVSAFMDAHLVEALGSYVRVEEVQRLFVQQTGDVHVKFSSFLAILRKAKGRFVYRNGHEYVYIDHALSAEPTPAVMATLTSAPSQKLTAGLVEGG